MPQQRVKPVEGEGEGEERPNPLLGVLGESPLPPRTKRCMQEEEEEQAVGQAGAEGATSWQRSV